VNALEISTFDREVGAPKVAGSVLELIDRMPPDPSLDDYRRKLSRVAAGADRYWDLACTLNFLAEHLRPRRYLEIGVRRGKSMVQIARGCPDCEIIGIDLWVQDYGGVVNPGPEFVREQMRASGHRGNLILRSGDSRIDLPTLAVERPGMRFDLATVDGDHSDDGAWADLCNVAPMLDVGGYMVFDDLLHPAHTLGAVWRRFREEFASTFDFTENLRDHNGTGVARRVA
jgi:predicted O-methyltransferase YrrM